MQFQVRKESPGYDLDFRRSGRAAQTVKSILRVGGRRRTLAPGPEKVDEEWQLSKDSADAATAKRTSSRQAYEKTGTDLLLPTDL